MRKKGFIFDLDGVIVDTAKYHYKAWKRLADQLGIPFSKESNEQFKGVSRKRCLELLLEWGNYKATPEQFEEWMAEKNRDYLEYIHKMDASEILPDVPRILQYLKLHHMPMAVGSASKNAKPILEKVGLSHYFDFVVDGTQVTKAKPDPEVFLIAANKLGVDPRNCVVFEDAVAGIEAANAAKMTSIGIGDGQILSHANYVFRDFTDIDLGFIAELIDKG
ncbi:beta-phosphoglucomutase [Flavobacteriaceae bacterium F89]|uniref:Beta-phosphoglucomutase n=1 Tax=Cerina litoralis TaxID=2874477 RepID=A0AAE3JUU6_9FLAO|nr:beta-phosphoglucomutase [Cerina litoralis]MCG2462752.1 beta-phosphoglucomutase [Cerina litoralis]